MTALIGASTISFSQVGVDGLLGAEWSGYTPTHVTHDDFAPTGNFGAPGPTTAGSDYDIYLRGDSQYLYGLVTVTGTPEANAGAFANLYFDLDPQNANGSDWGMEVTNHQAFVPGQPGYYGLGSNLVEDHSTGTSVEFGLKWSYLMDGGNPDVTFYGAGPVLPGGKVVLRLSQSFGYSVAGGASYGPDRLGAAFAPVPEPATMSMLAAGGLLFLGKRRKGAK